MKKSFDYLLFENYIDSWLTKDLKLFLSLLSSDIYIRECYGATYLSLAQAEKWFIHWNQPDNNKVLSWKICKHYYDFDEGVSIFEWSFAYVYKGEESSFDGASFVSTKDGKITNLKELQISDKLYFPYK